MRTAAISTGVGVALAISASGAMALGFGGVHNATVLGQPLSFTVPLRMDADEFVSVECVSAVVYSGDNRVPTPQVQVHLDPARDGGGRVLRVTTSVLIDEPVVTIDVGVGCPVRLSRKFVAFVDPPIVTLAQSAPAEPPRSTESAPPAAAPIAAPPVAAQATPRVERQTAVQAQRSTTPRRARPVARPSTITAADATKPRPRAQTAPAARAAAPAPAPSNGGARLQLEAAQALERPASAPQAAASAAPAPSLSADAAAAAAPAAAASSAEAIERERIRVLEESLARIRSDAEATRNSINALQARLRDEEARRYNNPLVYTLVAIIAALLFAMGLLIWWARSRERQRAEWWAAGADVAPRAPEPAPAPVSRPAGLPSPSPDSVAAAGFVESTRPATTPVTWKPTLAIPELDKNEVPKRPVSAEELIDLEQQAEFFVTLGQDDAAIDLLVGHLNSAGGTSPLPYLKLMEIHRRRGDFPAYERIREHFNQRFNAYAPPGDAPLPAPRSLEEHPELMAQLQEAWPTPPRAMGLLESLLFKPGEGDAAFDLAAYREVLFLHEVARDLFEHSQSPVTVDVLLPLDEGPQSVFETHEPSGTMPLNTTATRPIPVDLDLGQPRDEEAEQAAARTERRRERYGDDDFQFGSGTGSGFGDLGPGGASGRKR